MRPGIVVGSPDMVGHATDEIARSDGSSPGRAGAMGSCDMGSSEHGQARATFARASALVAGDFEAARGAFLSCVALDDPEWSPRAAVVLGDLLWDRGDADAAEPLLHTAVASGHPEWAAHAGIVLGVVLAARGDSDGAIASYRTVIAAGNVELVPHAWFNLGTTYQGRGDAEAAVDAFRHAMASGHPDFGPSAAVNLGFVLFNDLHDAEGAEATFSAVIASGHPEQAPLAARNLASMRQLLSLRDPAPPDVVEEPSGTDGRRGSGRRFWRRS
jgi:Flp pilus assembly protein TadD